MRDYFKENAEYEQLKKESEFIERENDINELTLEVSEILDDIDLFELLYEFDYIDLEQRNKLNELMAYKIILKEKTRWLKKNY